MFLALDLPRPNVAEDAPAFCWDGGSYAALAVFDGMGGAGAKIVDGSDGPHTAAWYAARIARDATQAALEELRREDCPDPAAADPRIAARITADLTTANRFAPASGGPIRSTMIRSYPTTAAILLAAAEDDVANVRVLWAGDSRCYVLSPSCGLQQLSVDDSRTGADPMVALREDSPLKHMISAEHPVELRARAYRLPLPCVLLAATDGAFGSLPSPMHFEWVLLEALARAAAPDDWRAGLAERLQAVASDDIALAAVVIGWPELQEAARAFAARLECLRERLEVIEADRAAAERVSREADELRSRVKERLATAWSDYRQDYMALLDAPGGVP